MKLLSVSFVKWHNTLKKLCGGLGPSDYFERFQVIEVEKLFMRVLFLSFLAFGLMSCSMNKATQGALTGTALGAGTGAIIGSATGKAGVGTAIGAGVGALGGVLVGNAMDNQDNERRQLEEQQVRQQQELERQRRELEELRRQQQYDDMYRRY